jgi:RsiW-degrading membrane proteinase PrsW (M82 family)
MTTTLELILAIITIVFPLVGGAFTAIMFYCRDVMEKEPREQIVKTLLWGLLSGIFCIAITIPMFFLAERLLGIITVPSQEISLLLSFVIIQAIVEEAIKGVILWQAILRTSHEIDGLFDGFFYGAMIGTGTGVVDAIAYAVLGGNWIEGFEIAIIRTIRIPGTHALFTGLIGLFFAWRIFKDRRIIPGIISAVGLHLLWNVTTFLISQFLEGFYYYLTNIIILTIYLVIMSVIIYLAVKYDKKNLPKGMTDQKNYLEEEVENQKRKDEK